METPNPPVEAPFRDLLLANGYKHFTDRRQEQQLGPRNAYQKCVRDPDGSKRYYITITESDWYAFKAVFPSFTVHQPYSYQAEVQFRENREKNTPLTNVDMSFEDLTLDELGRMEALLAQFFTTLGEPYYEKYES